MLPSMSRTVTSPIRRSWMLRVLIFVLQYLQSEEVFSNDRFGAPDCWSAIFQGESRADTGPPSRSQKIYLLHTVLTAAVWWNVELANSNVLIVGVPSSTFEKVFNTSG